LICIKCDDARACSLSLLNTLADFLQPISWGEQWPKRTHSQNT
jgi:hypothetical protein